MLDAPLFNALLQYDPAARFHMPAHNGAALDALYASAPFDVTELSFSDNLACPKGIILQAESKTAAAVGVRHSLFFTGGATSALFAAIYVLKEETDFVVTLGETHRSVTNALEIFGIKSKEATTLADIPATANAIIITSPDYYGNALNVRAVKERFPNALLLVDESHGAHFPYAKRLPESAAQIADLTVQSMHKTMPVYTGGALLHVQRERLYQKAVQARAKLGTSSPSYLVMASMDYARALFEANGENYYNDIYQDVRSLVLPKGFERVENDDFSRLVIRVPECTTGYAVAKAAEAEGIYFEMADERRLVAIITPFNRNKLPLLSRLQAPETTPFKDHSHLLGKSFSQDLVLYPPGKIILPKGTPLDEKTLEILNRDWERILGL